MEEIENPEKVISIREMLTKRAEEFDKLINKIKEDIKKHKQGMIDVLPSYLDYSKEFTSYSRNRIKKLILTKLNKEEAEYFKNYWREFVKQKFKERCKKNETIGDYAEELVKKQLEEEGWEVSFLKFNWEELEKRNKEICKKLYSLSRWNSCHLPDFICFNQDFFKFVEVKAGRTSRWDEKQKKGIEKLQELGYIVEIIKPEFAENEIARLLGEDLKETD